MKVPSFIIILLLHISPNYTFAQDLLGLKEIISGPTPAPYRTPDQSVKPYRMYADAMGGAFDATVNHKVGSDQFCPATYRFEWKFSQSVAQLYENRPVVVDYQVTLP